ncbi:MAG TPA: cation-transporting P-type ATPase, partial [Candidatus Limnocylindria bacterium]
MTPAHALPAAEVAAGAGVDPSVGLAGGEARRRLEGSGPNELAPQARPSIWTSLAATLREPFVILLALAGFGAVALGETRDGLLMLAGLVPIVGADVVTSYRSERALDALRDAAAPRAHVRRDGAVVEIPAAQVVPGDVLVLRAGDVVAADARVL